MLRHPEAILVSAETGEGLEEIQLQLRPARTGVLLGPSGTGKSTLINAILGEEVMPTREIHRSGEGRHTTSHRRLVQLPSGGMIIDTPGLREAQLWEGEDGLGGVFEDIEDETGDEAEPREADGARFCGKIAAPSRRGLRG